MRQNENRLECEKEFYPRMQQIWITRISVIAANLTHKKVKTDAV